MVAQLRGRRRRRQRARPARRCRRARRGRVRRRRRARLPRRSASTRSAAAAGHRPRGRPDPRRGAGGRSPPGCASPTRRSTPVPTCSSPATWASGTRPPHPLVAVLTGVEPVAPSSVAAPASTTPAWMRKTAAVRDAMRRARNDADDPMALLARGGGADLAAMTGFLRTAAVRRTPVLLDGVVVTAARWSRTGWRPVPGSGGRPGTAPPSRRTPRAGRASTSSRSSTSDCGSARAPARWSRCRSCARRWRRWPRWRRSTRPR